MEVGSRIPEKLFFRIGEVCELIKVQPHVLRYWETEFPMLAPQKNKAGQRVYRRKDVEMVFRIRDLLYEEKFTIAGAKKKLMEETRGAGRTRQAARDAEPESEEAALPDEPSHQAAEPEDESGTALLPGIASPPPAPPERQPRISTAGPKASASPGSPADATRSKDSGSASREKRVLRVLKTDLEDLLTRLNTDVTFKP
jgi:DNA-binding transcriptional MerR regulator